MYDYQAWRSHDAGRRALQIASDIDAGFKMLAGGRALGPRHDAPAPADWRAEREQAWTAIHAKAAEAEKSRTARPFRFEDLEGKPEPIAWGPVYPKAASAAVEKWRAIARGRELSADEARAYGHAVHKWIRGLNKSDGVARVEISLKSTAFNAARHRAKLIAAFHARAAADRLAWATGEAIKQAYAEAMTAKRARLARELELAA